MTTEQRSATAEQSTPNSSLMAQAAQSTTNLGWLHDVLLDWQTVRSVAIRLASKLSLQPRKDEESYLQLLEFIALGTRKVEVLEEAYVTAYAKHERLMIRLNEEISRD